MQSSGFSSENRYLFRSFHHDNRLFTLVGIILAINYI